MKNKFTKAMKYAGIGALVLAALPFVLTAAAIWLAVTCVKCIAASGGRRRKFSEEICR